MVRLKMSAFNDLNVEEKQRMIGRSREVLVQEEWWINVYDDAKICGALMGIDIDEIYFSGFASQGDGANFTGHYSYKKESIKKIKEYAPTDAILHQIAIELSQVQKPTCYGLDATIGRQGHYSHEHSTIITITDIHNEVPPSYERQTALSTTLRDFMCWIYSSLEKEYNYLTSDEVVSDWLANNYVEN